MSLLKVDASGNVKFLGAVEKMQNLREQSQREDKELMVSLWPVMDQRTILLQTISVLWTIKFSLLSEMLFVYHLCIIFLIVFSLCSDCIRLKIKQNNIFFLGSRILWAAYCMLAELKMPKMLTKKELNRNILQPLWKLSRLVNVITKKYLDEYLLEYVFEYLNTLTPRYFFNEELKLILEGS